MNQVRSLGGPGFELVDRVRATIARHGMLNPGEAVVAAVSGGPDSMCLLDVLARLQDRLDIEILVAHVDHGLSPESEKVAAHVGGFGSALGFDVHVVRAHDLAGPNLHERARELRYSFFNTLADNEGARRIATGHTLDDRVETTIARLIHGGGPALLAGVPAVEGRRVRPLIDSRRADTRAYCTEVGIDFYDDPANEDDRFERARVRHRVLPAITASFGEGAIGAIATSSERMAEDAAAITTIVDRLIADIVRTEDEGYAIETASLTALPRAFRRRVLEHAIGRIRDRSGGIDAALDALEADPDGEPREFAVAGGARIVVARDKVTIAFGTTPAPE